MSGRPASAGGARSGAPSSAGGVVAEALGRPLRSDGIRIVTIPAPVADPAAFIDAGPGPALFWTAPGAPVVAGRGSSHTIRADGPARFHDMTEASARLWERVDPVTHPDLDAPAPRLYGGFAFLPSALPSEWSGFDEAIFMLPRVLYAVESGAGARLSLAVTAEELERVGAVALAEEVEELLDRLTRGAYSDRSEHLNHSEPSGAESAAGSAGRTAPPHVPEASASVRSAASDRAEWRRMVASIQARLAEGRGEKIVAARRRRLELDRTPDLASVLRRLDRESATAARFLFRFDDSVFVGATPERLVGRTGLEVRTEALAGTVPAGSPEREERLRASAKDGVEHRYVVRAIAEALGPLCDTLDYPDDPRIQRLRHVVHLQTPFRGQLADPVHVLELVERLHPTPAVGGWPKTTALEWIEREEHGSRGWYAAPVGWFDADGNGEFGVALRSALLHGRADLRHADLFAGAGIVRDSDAAAEFEETEVKLRTMLDALGVVGPADRRGEQIPGAEGDP